MNKTRPNSSWGRIKTYINSKNIEDILERKTIIIDLKHTPPATIDEYRRRLCQVGILEVVGRGKYKIINKIPEKMNSTNLFKLSYELKKYPWKEWFIETFEEKFDDCLNK